MKDAAMPLQSGDLESIPWGLISPHEAQAQANHRQSLATLRERHGISPCEAVAILEDRPWRRMTRIEANQRLSELVDRYWEEA